MSEQNLPQKISHAVSNDENQASTSAAVSDISQVLKRISLPPPFNDPEWENTRFKTLLWNMLSLYCGKTGEILRETLCPKKVAKAMQFYLETTVEEAMIQDEDGNTILMQLLNNREELVEKQEFFVVLVQSLKNTPSALQIKNKDGLNALCLSAINYPQLPYIFAYLAGVMLQKGIDINEKLDEDGNTLLHIIASKGDEYVEILKEMLTLLKNNSDFNISCRNNLGETALHKAVYFHIKSSTFTNYLKIIKMLLENGADLMIKDDIKGETPLHVAFWKQVDDIELLKVLLKFANPALVNEKNNNGQTALHMAAKFPEEVKIDKHADVLKLLLAAGALTDVQDTKGRTPFDLVLLDRKNFFDHYF